MLEYNSLIVHWAPPQPAAQVQMNPFSRLVQDAPLEHGTLAHSLMSVKKYKILQSWLHPTDQ